MLIFICRYETQTLHAQVVSFFAGGVCRYEVVLAEATNKGWKMVGDDDSTAEKRCCNVFWIDTPNINDFFLTLQKWQCINHFPGMTNITRKARMCQNLEIMRKKYPREYSFYPKTFCLPRDIHLFRKNFGTDGRSENVYIIKPDGGAQGKGIFLTRNVNDIPPNSLCVAQHYILNPLLIEGKKFDLRIYVLVTSCKPLRVYLFNDGLVRICAEEFARPSTANLDDRCMHLTNYAVNKTSDKFVRDNPTEVEGMVGREGNKRSIKWFLEWLRKERGEAIVESLWEKIRYICGATILSIAPLLLREYNNLFGGRDMLYEASANYNRPNCNDPTPADETNTFSKNSSHHYAMKDPDCKDKCKQARGDVGGSRCFEVLGFDIMLDDHCTPILIETNHLPAFGSDCPVDRSVKKLLMEEVFAIIKARPQDEQVYRDYLINESKERLLGGKKNVSDLQQDEESAVSLARRQLSSIYTKHVPCHLEKIPLLVEKACEKYGEKQDQIEKFANDASSVSVIHFGGGEPSSNTIATIGDDNNNTPGCDCPSASPFDRSRCPSPKVESSEPNELQRTVPNKNNNSTCFTKSCDLPTHQSNSDFSENENKDYSEYQRFVQDLFQEEKKLLKNFERVYPPLESSAKYGKHNEIERFIFDEYKNQERRMTVPLYQSRSNVSEASVPTNHCSGSQSGRPTCRGDSWISGNPFIRRAPSPPKDLPFPTKKQIEAANRLSCSSAKLRASSNAVVTEVEEGTDCKENKYQQPSRRNKNLKTIDKEAIAAFTFEFDLLDDVVNREKKR